MYKKATKLLALFIAVLMLLTACSKGSSSTSSSSKDTGNTSSSSSSSGDTSKDASTTENVTLKMYYVSTGDFPDVDEVIEEMNRISGEAIGITIDAEGISTSNYSQQIRLMLAGREEIDIFNTSTLPFGDFGNQVANNQLMVLNDLLDQYGQDVKNILGNYIKAGTVSGKILALPTYRDEAKDAGIIIRTDLVEKYNLDVGSVKKLEDLEPLLQTIKDNEPDIAPFYPSQETYGGIETALLVPGGDTLGSDQYWTGVLLDATDKSMKVVNYYETEQYMELVRLMRSWYEKGLIMQNAATNQETPTDLVKAGKLAAQIYHMKPGIESQGDRACGMPMTYIRINQPVASSATPSAFMLSVAAHSQKGEAAVKYLNFIYTNKEINDVFNWGIQGKHWVLKDDGSITFPEGVDASTSGYYGQAGFVFGNQTLTYVWEGTPLDLWEQMDKYNKSAIQSVALGFQFDTNPIKTQYAACSNVEKEYVKAIGVGAVDPEVKVPEMLAKFKEAGVDEVIAEKQRQLDEWAKANGIK